VDRKVHQPSATMFASILAAMLMSQGTSAVVVDDRVFIEGRPGCEAAALNGDPTAPVIACTRPKLAMNRSGRSPARWTESTKVGEGSAKAEPK
jgi:hypothetical protein